MIFLTFPVILETVFDFFYISIMGPVGTHSDILLFKKENSNIHELYMSYRSCITRFAEFPAVGVGGWRSWD